MEEKIVAIVKSPAKTHHKRKGNGFSISEIKKAGKTIQQLKEINTKIDYFRKSTYDFNVEILKKIKVPKKKGEKREPFEKKEKKRTPFKPEIKKIKRKPLKKQPIKEKKAKPISTKKSVSIEKPITQKIPKQKVIPSQGTGTPLTNLQGLGPKTKDKFTEVGVNNVEDLIKESGEELSMLIKGVSLDSIKKWIEEGKQLLGK